MGIGTSTKILIVLQAGVETHEGRARALHSVLYATELAEAGAVVRLVFDGAGTGWLARWTGDGKPPSRAAQLFDTLRERGVAYEVCDYCAGAFEVREELMAAGEPLTGGYMDHPSIVAHVADGFAVWIL
jgi:DsrE/DsrF-like family